MVATEEARALLDALMGSDRNAALPPGSALPGRKAPVLQRKRNKSVYDKDIDPLYTAWGIDVYDLFVNTKSDIGPNPNTPDQGAHEEYMKLPAAEQEKLGFDYYLFRKLQELVRQGDRIVARNKEKLNQELSRKARSGPDFVEDVDEGAVEMLARGMIEIEDLQVEFHQWQVDLEQVLVQEEESKAKLEPLLEAQRQSEGSEPSKELQELQLALGRVTLEKQKTLFELARVVTRLAALKESTTTQHRNLEYVKSDVATDKTVCEVSGNFMSARDADERIAAHYAGKQYVGWKLVRDKFKQMQEKYGRYGPPPPARSDGGYQDRGGGGGYGRGGAGSYDRGYGGRGRGRGRFDGDRPREGDRRWERGPPVGGGGGGGGGGGYYDRRGPPRESWRR